MKLNFIRRNKLVLFATLYADCWQLSTRQGSGWEIVLWEERLELAESYSGDNVTSFAENAVGVLRDKLAWHFAEDNGRIRLWLMLDDVFIYGTQESLLQELLRLEVAGVLSIVAITEQADFAVAATALQRGSLVNLLPKHCQRRRLLLCLERYARVPAILLICALACLLVVVGYEYYTLRQRKEQLTAVQAAVDSLQPWVQLRAEAAELERSLQAYEKLQEQLAQHKAYMGVSLTYIGQLLHEDCWLESVAQEKKSTGFWLRLQGSALSEDALQASVEALRSSGYYSRVEIAELTQKEKTVLFTIALEGNGKYADRKSSSEQP